MLIRWWYSLPIACRSAWGNLFDFPLIDKVKASLIHVEYLILDGAIVTGIMDILDLNGKLIRMGLKWSARGSQSCKAVESSLVSILSA